MLNEYISERDIDAYVNGFTYMTADELSAFITTHELSLSLNELVYIQNYFKCNASCFPTYNQLDFFNELCRIRKAQKSDYAIYSASAKAGAEEIFETSKDLLSKKRSLIKKRLFGAMPASYAAQISAEYLNQAGLSNESYFISAENLPNADYYIHGNDGVPLFAYRDPKAKTASASKATHGNASFVMLCPLYDMDDAEYVDRVNAFLSLNEVKSAIAEQATISAPYGIYGVLVKETNGIFTTLSNIPETEKNENGKTVRLSSLLSSYVGRYIFTVDNVSLGLINQLAMQYSLGAYVFATRNYSKKFTLESIKNPAFSFDFEFLKGFAKFKEQREYIFSKESDSPIGSKEAVFLTTYKDAVKRTYRADRVINFGKTVAAATSRKLSASPHKTAALAVIDAANSLIAKGVAKSSITLAVSYSLPEGTDDAAELGKNLAAILGVYRSTIELSLAQSEPRISYNNGKRSVTIVASAKAPKRAVENVFKNGNTKVYFLPVYFSENGLPDYEKYRKLIARFYQGIENDSVLSAFAINENLTQTVKSAAKLTRFDFLNDFEFESPHGILFESYENLLLDENLFLVGETTKIDSAE